MIGPITGEERERFCVRAADDPAVAAMTPSERIAMVFEMTRRLYAARGIDATKLRMQKHIVRKITLEEDV